MAAEPVLGVEPVLDVEPVLGVELVPQPGSWKDCDSLPDLLQVVPRLLRRHR